LFQGPADAGWIAASGEESDDPVMSKIEEEGVRIAAVSVLDAMEVAIAGFAEIFRDVAGGTALDPQRAETLAAQCAVLLKNIVETRNVIQLSGRSRGVH
jgi:hypothetical protein